MVKQMHIYISISSRRQHSIYNRSDIFISLTNKSSSTKLKSQNTATANAEAAQNSHKIVRGQTHQKIAVL
jgi:hypothetical protein